MARFAALLEAAGLDVLLVGDPLGSVLQERDSTLAVPMRDIVCHTPCVATLAAARSGKTGFQIAGMAKAALDAAAHAVRSQWS